VGATDGADELAWVQAGVVDRPPERLVLPAEVVEKTTQAFLCRPGISIIVHPTAPSEMRTWIEALPE
jgi:hypothetical protein